MGFKARDIMTAPFVSVHPNASVDEVLAQLLRHHISGLPVVDDEGNLRGVVTEFDLLKLLYEPKSDIDGLAQFISEDVITVDDDDSLPDVADIFLTQPVRRLPVLRDGKILGIISRRDLVRFIHLSRVRLAQDLEERRLSAAGSA